MEEHKTSNIPNEVIAFSENSNDIVEKKGRSTNTAKIPNNLKVTKEKGYQDKTLYVISFIEEAENSSTSTKKLGGINNFRAILEDKQKNIKKITYTGKDPAVFIYSLEALKLDKKQ